MCLEPPTNKGPEGALLRYEGEGRGTSRSTVWERGCLIKKRISEGFFGSTGTTSWATSFLNFCVICEESDFFISKLLINIIRTLPNLRGVVYYWAPHLTLWIFFFKTTPYLLFHLLEHSTSYAMPGG